MSIVKSIRIQNFKSLEDVTIDLSQLTFLFGANSSGKSSFLKALMFLSRNVSSFVNTGKTNYQISDDLNLRNFSEIVIFGDIKKKIEFEFNVTIERSGEVSHNVTTESSPISSDFYADCIESIENSREFVAKFVFQENEYGVNLSDIQIRESSNRITFNFSQPFEFEDLLESEKEAMNDTVNSDSGEFAFERIEGQVARKTMEINCKKGLSLFFSSFSYCPFEDEILTFEFPNDKNRVFERMSYDLLKNEFVRIDGLEYHLDSNQIDKSYLDSITRIKEKYSELLIDKVLNGIRQFLEMAIMPTTRVIPKKAYLINSESDFDKVYYGIVKALYEDTVLRNEQDSLKFINEEIKNFGFGFGLKFTANDDVSKLMLEENNKVYDIANQSSGLIQLFPIMFYCLYEGMRETYQTLLIEQPELHLHPRLQSQLADLFVRSIKLPKLIDRFLFEEFAIYSSKDLIIETHSEHLIRKIQVLIAKGELEREKVAVWYFKKVDGITKVEKMEIDENGLFKNDWPDGFFDDSVDLTMELFEALRKRKN